MARDDGAERAAGGRRRLHPLLWVALALALAIPGVSRANPSALCDAAAAEAAARHGVPLDVLRAITRVETGRARDGRLEPWPWTVNMEGAGRWFDGPRALLAYVEAERARGARSFDLGCFQVNHLWHGERFPSLEAMVDPRANADYAARFLRDLRAEAGDWTTAAGWYHSRTPEFFNRYRDRFLKVVARLRDVASPPEAAVELAAAEAVDEAERWRMTPPAAPHSPGAVVLRLAAGGVSPLRVASGPLFGPRAAPAPPVAPKPAEDRAFP